MRIYLDVCCLNRPFDDHTQDKIRLESEAVLTILSHVSSGSWQMIGSDVISFEISKTPDPDRIKRVRLLANLSKKQISLNKELINRARIIEGLKVKPIDALHLACAEEGNVDVFLTTDQELIAKCRKNQEKIRIKVSNPVKWLMEVL